MNKFLFSRPHLWNVRFVIIESISRRQFRAIACKLMRNTASRYRVAFAVACFICFFFLYLDAVILNCVMLVHFCTHKLQYFHSID